LINIFKELHDDIGVKIPASGNLTRWAKQGVLLLNASLTVRAADPMSHSKIGWAEFTNKVIEKISEVKQHVVFLLWGKFAQEKRVLIDESKHLILRAANLSDREHFQKWMDAAFADSFAGTRIPFSIIVKKTGEIAGSMSLMNISYHDLRTEIGSSWLGKDFRGTDINRHAKYAMMRYAFEELNFERVEFKTDVLNERAKQGLRKVGGKEEGVLRSHMTMWHGRRRDSIYFSVIKNEWPSLKQTIFKD